MNGDSPKISSIESQRSNDFEFLADFVNSFEGSIYFEIETSINMNLALLNSVVVPIKVKVELKSIHSNLRVCYVPLKYGKSWFSFIGEPVLSINIDPIIMNNFKITNIPKVSMIIR